MIGVGHGKLMQIDAGRTPNYAEMMQGMAQGKAMMRFSARYRETQFRTFAGL